MNPQQPREANGRFDETPNSSPEVQLKDPSGDVGTFLFPPTEWPGGQEQYVAFWRNAEVSDETLSGIVAAYNAERDAWQRAKMARWARDFGNSDKALLFKTNMERIKRGDSFADFYDENRTEYLDELDKEYPERMPLWLARPAARAAQMHLNLETLHPNLRQGAVDSVIHVLPNGQEVTASALWKRWKLGRIFPDALVGQAGVERKLSELISEIGWMRAEMKG